MTRQKQRTLAMILFFTALIMLIFLIMQPLLITAFQDKIAVLFPKGIIGIKERNLLLLIQGLMLIVIIPVFLLTFAFSWIYRYYNSSAKYDPDLVDSTMAECIWWAIPCLMILVISIITWIKTYELDPFKPIASEKKAKTIQVVALQWKWLFIYPEEKIATVNFVSFPKDTPVHFEITADAPMNSFWIPHLGGQIYAMPKMKTELYLMANEEGEFRGSSANLSGEGFAGMHFIAKATSEEEYKKWVESVKEAKGKIDFSSYQKLAIPSQNHPVELFNLTDDTLFDQVIMKYMHP